MVYYYLSDKSDISVSAALGISPYAVRDYSVAAKNYNGWQTMRIISEIRKMMLPKVSTTRRHHKATCYVNLCIIYCTINGELFFFSYFCIQNFSCYCMEIKESSFVKSSAVVDQCPPGHFARICFHRKVECGKSSLINMLTKRKKLAMTSAKPGKTLLINHFLIDNNWHLVDLPDMGLPLYRSR